MIGDIYFGKLTVKDPSCMMAFILASIGVIILGTKSGMLSMKKYPVETSIYSVRPSISLKAVSSIWLHEECKSMSRSLGIRLVVLPFYITLYSMKIDNDFFEFVCFMQLRTDYPYIPSFSMKYVSAADGLNIYFMS